jgi:2-C-methyl-D-erythritol 4-phosphate cytidylyltransferase
MSLTVIITAGGIGKRMNSSVPKQFLTLKNKPILMHTIERFYHYDNSAQILVTLPKDWWDYWKGLIKQHNFTIPIQLIEGGEERYHSIKEALRFASGDFVAVHDGVRPCVSHETIRKALDLVPSKSAVVPVLPLKESIRKGSYIDSRAEDRSLFYMVQTPQCFLREVLLNAYKQDFSENITDDASLVEQMGQQIYLVEGNPENIKITAPIDLKIAELFL